MNNKKPLGLKPLDFSTDFINLCEPIIIDNPTEQEEELKKKVIEALKDVPKPKFKPKKAKRDYTSRRLYDGE